MNKLKIWLLGTVVVVIGVLYFNRGTWQMYRGQNTLRQKNNERMNAAENERADLLRRRAEVNSPIGKERMARQKGYKEPGEQPIELRP